MNSEDVAAEVVDILNELEDKPFEYKAEIPEQIGEAHVESGAWKVFVAPYAEFEEPIDRGDACRETVQLSVVVCGELNEQTTRDRGGELMKFLRDGFREQDFGGWMWEGSEAVVLYDPEALKSGYFLSEFRPSFYRFA